MEKKFLKRFDLVKSKFKKNLKDNIFKQEIEKFTKYNILDENNMFNYIYIHNYYENLIENPFEYKVNIISKNREQINSFISSLFDEKDVNYDFDKKFMFQTSVFFNDKSVEKFYDLYLIKDKEKMKIITKKSFKEILEYLNDEKNNEQLFGKNKDSIEILITTTNYKFNSYPSVIFNFFVGENYDIDIIPLINDNLEKEYKEKNNNLILLEQDILNQYFNNKDTLYLNDQIYHRVTSILTTLNIFFFNDEEWEQDKDSLLEKIKIKKEEKYKEILINNIICNNIKNKLYFIDKEKEKDLFSSNTSYEDENNYNIIENIHKLIFTHFKIEMNFGKTFLLNFNSLINDHMKITFTKSDPLIPNENIIFNLKNNISALIKDLEDDYIQKRDQVFQNVLSIPKDLLLNNMESIKQDIDSRYFITNGVLDHFQTEIINYLSNYQTQILSYMTEIDNLNINIFYSLKKLLNKQGIFSINFDGLIKIIAVERIKVQDPIQDLLQEKKNTLKEVLASFGLSGIVGGAASFLAGKATSTIGADAAAGTFGGSVGIGVGVVLGVGTLFVQARNHFKGNREAINSLFEEMNKNISETVNTVEESINKEKEKIIESMEKDIKEINDFIDIIIDRVIKLLSE